MAGAGRVMFRKGRRRGAPLRKPGSEWKTRIDNRSLLPGANSPAAPGSSFCKAHSNPGTPPYERPSSKSRATFSIWKRRFHRRKGIHPAGSHQAGDPRHCARRIDHRITDGGMRIPLPPEALRMIPARGRMSRLTTSSPRSWSSALRLERSHP